LIFKFKKKKKMKTKLNVAERLTLVQIIPEKGNFKTMSTVEKVKTTLYLSEEEREEFEVKQAGNNLAWNEKGSEQREIEFSDFGRELIIESLEKLDKEENLTSPQFLIYKQFKEEEEKAKAEEVKEIKKPKGQKKN